MWNLWKIVLLFVVLTPGIFLTLPPVGKRKIVAACVHALIFVVLFKCIGVEGFQDVDGGQDEESSDGPRVLGSLPPSKPSATKLPPQPFLPPGNWDTATVGAHRTALMHYNNMIKARNMLDAAMNKISNAEEQLNSARQQVDDAQQQLDDAQQEVESSEDIMVGERNNLNRIQSSFDSSMRAFNSAMTTLNRNIQRGPVASNMQVLKGVNGSITNGMNVSCRAMLSTGVGKAIINGGYIDIKKSDGSVAKRYKPETCTIVSATVTKGPTTVAARPTIPKMLMGGDGKMIQNGTRVICRDGKTSATGPASIGFNYNTSEPNVYVKGLTGLRPFSPNFCTTLVNTPEVPEMVGSSIFGSPVFDGISTAAPKLNAPVKQLTVDDPIVAETVGSSIFDGSIFDQRNYV